MVDMKDLIVDNKKQKMSKKPIVALIYDFDGTLSPGNMQEFGFIQAIKKDPKVFWQKNKALSEENDASGILSYMYLMLQNAQNESISLRRDSFKNFGKDVELFKGVKEWFSLINRYGKSIGVIVEHYINSSGLIEMIEGTPIAKEFKKIYACSYLYDVDGKAVWPAVAVDYTAKTQFLFKINKGIEEVSDNKKINQFIPQDRRRVPFSNMIYFGDGETDIPCMKLVKEQGGHSIAVYKPGSSTKKQIAETLIKENRVNFVCAADYSENKDMFKVVKTIIGKIKADTEFRNLQESHIAKCSSQKEENK